jgi:hypothetical protein
MEKLINFYKNLKPLHLFLFGTVFLLLARTSDNNLGFEMGCLFASLFTYILALSKYIKTKK